MIVFENIFIERFDAKFHQDYYLALLMKYQEFLKHVSILKIRLCFLILFIQRLSYLVASYFAAIIYLLQKPYYL